MQLILMKHCVCDALIANQYLEFNVDGITWLITCHDGASRTYLFCALYQQINYGLWLLFAYLRVFCLLRACQS
jgi:hypothetical protein